MAHGKWNCRLHFLSQQAMLAPLFLQNVHFCSERRENFTVRCEHLMIISINFSPVWMLFAFLSVYRQAKNHKHRRHHHRFVVDLNLATAE